MSTISSTSEVKLEPVKAYWGQKHCRSWLCVADASGSLNDTYLDLNTIGTDFNEIEYYVWYNINSLGTDPAIAGKTGIEVSEATDATAEEIAIATKAAIEGVTGIRVKISISGETLTLENTVLGEITPELDSGLTGFTLTVLIDAKGGYLGKTSTGGSTINIETNGVELTSDQDGAIVIGESYAGASVSVDMGLIEVSKERLAAVIGGVVGGTHTPSGGTELVGMGQSKLFQLLNNIGGQLILHPVRLPQSDKTFDFTLHKSAPKPSSINYSGQDQQVLEVSFTGYLDESVSSDINLFAWGDWSQDLA